MIKHIPTQDMWAYMNTKPQQGMTYLIDQRKVMNCRVDVPGSKLNEKLDEQLASPVDD